MAYANRHAAPTGMLSPTRLFLVLLTVLFSIELAIMYALLPWLTHGDRFLTTEFADSLLLSLISAPFLWYFVVRPIRGAAFSETKRAVAILGHVVDGVIIFDEQGTIESFNPSAELIFGYAAGEVLGEDVRAIIHGIELHDLSPKDTPLTAERPGDGISQERTGFRKDGSAFTMEISVSRVSMGEREIFIGIMRDISARKKAKKQLHETNQRLSAIVQASPLAIVAFDQLGNIEIWNKAAERIFGWPEQEVIGRPYPAVPKGKDEEHLELRKKVMAGNGFSEVELQRQRMDGTSIDVAVSSAPLRDADGSVTGIMSIIADITERKRIEAQLIHLANHDSVTDLPNRNLFRDRLNQAIAYHERSKMQICVMFLDLDHFKIINDTLGHPVGDLLLQAVAGRLLGCVRRCDTVARQGGDEFTLMLPYLSGTYNASTVAKKIIDVFASPFHVGGHEFFATASIGITIYPLDGDNLDTLLRNADTAMYHAKEQGRNNYQFYSRDLNGKIFERLSLETSLRIALERDQFLVHYQPRINLETGRIMGMEALVRWHHPEKGLISPGTFIPLAEETGMIIPLGEWVLRTACAQNKAWQEMGLPPLRVAVNLSARQVKQQDLPALVTRVLEETGLAPCWLELELTESILMQNVEQTIKTLHDLRAMGVHLSVDDFGTGYSSLSYLKRFPINTLKIDQSFVRDIPADLDDAAIVKTIITMAHTLGLSVTAEGVETEDQLMFLREYGCEEMQGYYFSRPLDHESFTCLLHEPQRQTPASPAAGTYSPYIPPFTAPHTLHY